MKNVWIPYSSADRETLCETIRLIRAKDQAATAWLYDTCQGARERAIKKFGETDAEDLLSEVFIDVLAAIHRGQIRQPERLMAFTNVVLRNKIARMTIARHRASRCQPLSRRIAQTETPEHAVISIQERQQTRLTLKRLCPVYRDVLEQHFILEKPMDAILSSNGITAGQFYLLKYRALRRAKEQRNQIAKAERNRIAKTPLKRIQQLLQTPVARAA